MTGPDHYRKADELAAKAHEYLGRGEGQDSAAVWGRCRPDSRHPRLSCCYGARKEGHGQPRLG